MHDDIRHFITHEMMRKPNYPLGDDEPLMTGGLIDSFSLVELALFIEEQFGVHIPDPELTVENMDNINLIVQRIQEKQA